MQATSRRLTVNASGCGSSALATLLLRPVALAPLTNNNPRGLSMDEPGLEGGADDASEEDLCDTLQTDMVAAPAVLLHVLCR
jgi:hypothetical protein